MERLYGLDLLRGVAALIVLVMHAAGFAGGHLAVDFFFMLSGFVMTRTYEQRLREGRIAPLRFVAMRFARLWPVMAIGAALGLNVALAAGTPPDALLVPFALALLLPGSASTPYLLNLPAWSIFYEVLANAIHALGLARLGNRALAGVLAVMLAGFLAAFAVTGFPRILAETSVAMQLAVVFRALLSYGIGMLAFRLVGDHPPVRVPLWCGLLLLPGYVALVSWWAFPLWPVPFVLVVAPLVLLSGLDRTAPPRLSHILGTISFPLYAVHFPILSAAALAGLDAASALALCVAAAALWLLPGFAPRGGGRPAAESPGAARPSRV